MKKRILSILLAVMMVVSVFVMPVSATEGAETIYSYNGFIDGDVRTIVADKGQVVDLGFVGAAATEPVVDGVISTGEYTKTNTIPQDNGGEKSVDVNYAVYGDYLYIAVDTAKAVADVNTRATVQYDIGIAASGSGEATWNRLGINVSAAGVVAASRSPFVHEYGSSRYSDSLYAVRNADYLVDQAFAAGVYEAKFDLGQLYRLFANLPGGQQAWDSPTVNFSFWVLTGGEFHFAFPNTFTTVNGRSGGWVSSTVIIPQETLDALAAKYKGVIGPLGYDYRNAVAGQLVSIENYATVAPTVDGVVNAADAYTTTGSWATNKKATIGDIVCNFSVINGYLYGAFVCDGEFTGDPKTHFGTFAAVNSTSMRDSRCQTTINADGTWKKDNGGMWKNAQGPTTAPSGSKAGNWENKELNSGTGAHQVWKNVAYAYDASTGKSTVEFQINIPNLLAILQFEGYNTAEANAVQFMFWPVHAGASAGITLDATTLNQVRQTNGYAYHTSDVLPTVELPKGCSELYTVSDVDDMEAFGQRVVEAEQSTANVDGYIGSGEYTATNYWSSTDFVSYNNNAAKIDSTMTQTDYYAYDADYFYYAAKIYDPYFTPGKSLLQMNLSVLNKHDAYTVTNTFTNADNATKTTVKTLRENYIDIADVITRASWDNTLNNDGVATNMNSKPGCVLRSQTLTSGTLAADVQAAFKERANTFADAGYQFAGHYDEATQTYVYEAKIPLDELKNLFQLGDDYDINSINVYTLYKFTPASGTSDYAVSYKLRDDKLNAAWEALRTLTQASKGSTGTPYNQDCIPNVVKLVDAPITKEGASIRIASENAGLRFKSVYTNEYLAYMAAYAEAKGETMEIGTLIAPADFITGEFTHAALDALGTDKYIEVMAKLDTPYANANGVTTIAGSIVNIKAANLNRDFAGIGFIRIGDEIFYADTYSVRNVAEVATAALEDTTVTYAPGQILILQKLNGTAAN